jgi:hypothetical protein
VAADFPAGPQKDDRGAKDPMMARNGFRSVLLTVATATALLAAASAQASRTETFANGIRATIWDAADVGALCSVAADGTRVLDHPLAGSVTLAPATRTLYPFDVDVVVAALATMTGFRTGMDIQVFILDGIPTETGSSFARRGAIFLSPSFAPVDPAITSYITTHEVGHVMTWAYMDGQAGRWEAYAALRNLDLEAAGPDVPHAHRAREIVAEDFRYLFGGALATRGIGLENHDLLTPDHIDGLRELLAGYLAGTAPVTVVSSHAFPNPCNPRTTIELLLPAGAAAAEGADLAIYDIRGQRVRRLLGGTAANGRVAVIWDGSDDAGQPAPSGRYLYVIRAAAVTAKGAVTLVR